MTNQQSHNPHTVDNDTYDEHIIPAEIAARRKREGANYKHTPKSDATSIDSTAGYSVDSEGLVNNYGIEPEMYYQVPGDARSRPDVDEMVHPEALAEINDSDEVMT
jgi:hypothetical protein